MRRVYSSSQAVRLVISGNVDRALTWDRITSNFETIIFRSTDKFLLSGVEGGRLGPAAETAGPMFKVLRRSSLPTRL
jgi:hypothetical protein